MENEAKMDELLAQIKLLVSKMDTSLQNDRLISDKLSGSSRAEAEKGRSRAEAERGHRESVRSRNRYNEEEEEEEEGLGIGKNCFPSPMKLFRGLKCCGMTGREEEED